jgi:hypothetical protein
MDKVCFWCWRKRRIVCEGKKKETSGSALSLSPLALSGSHARRGWLCGIKGSAVDLSGCHAGPTSARTRMQWKRSWFLLCGWVTSIHPRLVFGHHKFDPTCVHCFLFIYVLSEPMENTPSVPK